MKHKEIFIWLLVIMSISFSCQNESKGDSKNQQIENVSEFQNDAKKPFYQEIMAKKGISLSINGPCDDALEDTLHEKNIAYIKSQEISDSSVIVEFKFKDVCCKEHLGDYTLKNDTLLFKFTQVNDAMCSCMCWYQYLLKIRKTNINHIEITSF